MVKITKEDLEAIQSELENVDSSWQEEFNLKETVQKCFYLIQEARKYKVSWERITQIIKAKAGVDQEISPLSVSKYYLELAKNPDSLPKKPRRKKDSKQKKSDTNKASTAIDATAVNDSADHALINEQKAEVEETNRSTTPQTDQAPATESIEPEPSVDNNSKKKFGSFYNASNQSVEDQFNY